ncbi:PREDICTED: protein abrupt-like [Polistes dominula]|uniref:Protein abrupt-like n=1 Tax=Polistes dominula TaxID=743375 RepID=A0ABM1HWW0_POLDO|nr:PREDICTED: protein abrupt-like [Polistes dominula]
MKEETMLSLKWHSFHSHLAVSLDTCYEKQQFVDLSLVCKDGTILKCHKMVLANSSPFFRRLLVANDHPHPMIILHDIEADDLKTIVNFMYCGEIKVVKSEVRRLLKLAEILEVTGLRHIQRSFLTGEHYNASQEVPKKTTTMAPSKVEDNRNSNKSGANSDFRSKVQNKNASQSSTFLSSLHPCSSTSKTSQDTAKRNEESNITSSSQRFESSRPNHNKIDINDIPSTSKGLQPQMNSKRKTSDESVISWQKILSTISKDKQLPLKRLCIMDEVEITPGKPSTSKSDIKRDEPLDRRKSIDIIHNNTSMKCAVFIKDELDVSSELEENADMDPLEIEELESENTENVVAPKRTYNSWNVDRTYNTRKVLDFPPKKGPNS